MKYNLNCTLLVFLALILCQCKTKNVPAESKVSQSVSMHDDHEVIFLDSIQAADGITTDNKDHFFERVTFTEISIQMKKKRDCDDRKVCVQEYKDFLKTDVEDFTESEIATISEIFTEIREQLTKVNVGLIDRDIILIKTKGNHYGDGTFYTRENKIVIPQDVLIDIDRKRFKETMLHEFFHIFSRYNKDSRDQLYELIGFKPVNGTIQYGEKGSRKLLNPDGTTDYYIELENHALAYPLITATEDGFVESKPSFFNYLDFHLYDLQVGEDGIYYLKDQIQFDNAPSFFTQIKDNTNYIIHPDEISADNFIYTIFYLADTEKIKEFSVDGMKLIEDFGTILKAHQ